MRLLVFLFLLLIFVSPAHAERVMEVQGVKVEAAGRDLAVLEATKKAAAQVLTQIGNATPLPDLTPTQAQSLTTYVDIASESAQANYYAATFNVGIRVNKLLRLVGGQAEAEDASVATAAEEPVYNEMPRWVLVVPVHETAAGLVLWNPADPWATAWQRAGNGNGLTTAAAGGDAQDQKTLTAAQLQDYSVSLADSLSALVRKYNAPAIALVTLHTENDPIRVDDELKIDVTYLERGLSDLLSANSSLFVSNTLAINPLPAAMNEAQRLIKNLATGQPTTPQPPTHTATPSLNSQTVYSGVAPRSATQKLWVRIPLTLPSDLATYRSKIASIPNTQFEITALNRMYVEGNIFYNGSQAALLQELAKRGLAQQQ